MTTETTITTVTLKDACGRYLEHLKAIGKKPSTLGTARRTMDLLIADMGEDKEVGKILPLHVDKFFKSEAATMQPGKDGPKPRAEASVLQIRRIVRAALVWWKEEGYSERLPIPASEKHFIESKTSKAKVAKDDKAKRSPRAKAKTKQKVATDKKSWTGFSDDDEAKAQEGETVASMHFGGKGE